MRVLPLCLLLFISYSYAICDYGFDRPIDRQFVDMVERYFTPYETFKQREVQQIVGSFVREKRGRKKVLQHLINIGYLAVENSPHQNRLFSDILSKPSEEVIQTIKENPESLYEGTLLNLPPFFLVVFVGEKKIMETSIKIDRNLVNSKNPLQEVPLHYTLDPDMATGLFFYNARPNEPDKKGRVPLYNSRNPDTVKVMLYYNANPMVRDRSGIPLIRYHREQVGDREIVDLLEEARDSQRSLKVVRNKKPVVNQKTEEEMRTEAERRLEEERRKKEQKRAETERAKEKRLVEARRKARRAETEEANRRKTEERKSKLLSDLADIMATAMVTKAMIHRISHKIVDLKIFSNVASTLQSVQKQSSHIVIYDKALEDKFEQELNEVIKDIEFAGKTMEKYEKEVIDVAESKTQDLENELLAQLKREMGGFSIGKIRGILNKTRNYYDRLEKMMNQVVKIRMAQNLFLKDVIREIEVHPGAVVAILRRGRGELIQSLPFR